MKYRGIALILPVLLFLSMTGANYFNKMDDGNTLAVPAAVEIVQEASGAVTGHDMKSAGKEPDAGQQDASQQETSQQGTGQQGNNQQITDSAETSAHVIPVPPRLRFIAVGDIMPGRSVGKRLEKADGGYKYAFENVGEILRAGDIIFANLEAPLTSSTHGLDKTKKIVLKGAPVAIEVLNSAGFNLISLANNHMLDYYDTGLFDTISLLDKSGIAHSGAGKNIEEAIKPAIVERNGLRIGLLAYTDMAKYIYAGSPAISFAAGENKAGVAPREYEAIKNDIALARSSVDLLAVSLHWGVEESFTITPEQVDFAHKLLDDGADMILGHHPHQFQGMEIYKGKPIFYSMGNFLFDQNDPENMESFIIDMEYSGNQLSTLSAIPVRIVNKCHLEIQTGKNAENILTREAGLCSALGTVFRVENDKMIFDFK